jgi:hypothetical protein
MWEIHKSRVRHKTRRRKGGVGQTGRNALKGACGHGGILFNELTDEDGAVVFRHACKLGFEGILSKRPVRERGPNRSGLPSLSRPPVRPFIVAPKLVVPPPRRPFPRMLLVLGTLATPCCFVMPARIAATDPFRQINEYVGSGLALDEQERIDLVREYHRTARIRLRKADRCK